MSTLNAKETRNAILNAISKRAQTKFAKLFYEMDKNPTTQHIILVLQELNEQRDFYVDFNISLKYFLDLYEDLAASNRNFLFNEAGLLVHSATKIYDRRLDCVFQRIEEQMLALSNASNTNASETPKEDTTDTAAAVEKPTKKRKRVVELALDPFEFQWTRRKFKKLSEDKRFGVGAKIDRSKLFAQKLHVENYLHPALWKYSEIIDLENEEEVDSKRNYKLFTSYVEHRYNTLVPDINFRLYYTMKDFLDAEDERDNDEEAKSIWPPLSQAFIKQYLKIEDRALAHVSSGAKRRCLETGAADNATVALALTADLDVNTNDEMAKNQVDIENEVSNCNNAAELSNISEKALDASTAEAVEYAGEKVAADSGLGSSLGDSAILSESSVNNSNTTVHNSENAEENVQNSAENELLNVKATCDSNAAIVFANDSMLTESGLGSSIADKANGTVNNALNNSELPNSSEALDENLNTTLSANATVEVASSTALHSTQLEANNVSSNIIETPDNASSETVALTVHIETDNGVLNDKIHNTDQRSTQKNDDEGVCLSDIDEGPLTPITIHVEKNVLNGAVDMEAADTFQVDLNNLEEFHLAPHQTPIEFWPIKLNILEFSPQFIKKLRRPKLLTDLGEEMESFLRARMYKRTRGAIEYPNPRRFKLLDRSVSSASNVYNTPPPSPCDFEMVLLGFDEAGKPSLRALSNNDLMAKNNNEEQTMHSMEIGERNQRMSRDSGVGNDLLAAPPDKRSTLLHSISEDSEKTQEAKKDNVCKNLLNVEILENVLLQSASECTEKANANEQENTKSAEDVQTAMAADVAANIEQTKNVTNDSFLDGAIFNTEPFVPDTALINDDKRVELCDDTVAKIQTWHRTLQPILAKSRERHHFDVFQIGTNILNEFNNKTQANDNVTLEDVMQQQDPSYVSRYFLSALLLANQGNIDLKVHNKHEDKPSEWSDVSFKLLSNTRHVISVEDNIGMLPTTSQKVATVKTPTVKNTKSPKKLALLPTPPPLLPAQTQQSSSRKRKLSNAEAVKVVAATAVDAFKFVATIKPIGKTVRLSSSDDSGIASLESELDLVS